MGRFSMSFFVLAISISISVVRAADMTDLNPKTDCDVSGSSQKKSYLNSFFDLFKFSQREPQGSTKSEKKLAKEDVTPAFLQLEWGISESDAVDLKTLINSHKDVWQRNLDRKSKRTIASNSKELKKAEKSLLEKYGMKIIVFNDLIKMEMTRVSEKRKPEKEGGRYDPLRSTSRNLYYRDGYLKDTSGKK